MCLIFIAANAHPRYPLIIAGNRDEFYARRTEPAAFWSDHPEVLAGRDLEAGGTWMGLHRNGRIAMITNYRDPANINPTAPSRGELVSRYLLESASPDQYLSDLKNSPVRYNGYNLIAGDARRLWYYSNYGNEVTPLRDGVYGLSNHLLNTPWPKVKRGLEQFKPLLQSDQVNVDDLLEMLRDETPAPDDDLPNTGVGLDWERGLSPMFIKMKSYGSRCSTVILAGHEEITFTERVYNLTDFSWTTNQYQIPVSL